MAAIAWSGVSGDWTTGADWIGGVAPGAADDVSVSAAGAYTLTIGSADAAHSLTLSDPTAVVALNSGGALNLGSTLSVNAGTFELIFGGTVRGGTLSADGGAFQWFGGTLDGVTYDGTLDLSGMGSSLLVTSNGLIVKGAGGVGQGVINETGFAGALYLEDNQTFDNATINIGSAGGSGVVLFDTTGAGATLTLGAHLTVDQATGYGYIAASKFAGDKVINEGAINATLAGSQFHIIPLNFINHGAITAANGDLLYIQPAGNFANAASGTISIGAGSLLTIGLATSRWSNAGSISANGASVVFDGSWSDKGGLDIANSTVNLGGSFATASLGAFTNQNDAVTISGALTNTGATLFVGAGSALGSMTLTGTISGGVIADAGSGLAFDEGVLAGVTYEGTVDLSADGSVLTVTSQGLTATGVGGVGPGLIDITGNFASAEFDGAQTIDNATINLGSAGGAVLDATDSANSAPTLTLGTGLTINQAGQSATISGAGFAGEKIVNAGAINATSSGGRFLIDPQNFTNTGSMTVANGATLTMGVSVGATNLTNFGGGTLTGGRYEVDANSTLQLQDLGIITDNAVITLNGAGSVIQSFNPFTNTQDPLESTLTTIGTAGTLNITGGRDYTSANAIGDSGILDIGGGTFSTAALTDAAGSILEGFGTVTSAFSDAGTVVTDPGETLAFTGSSTFGVGAVVDGAGILSAANATLAGLTLGGTATFADVGSVDQTGSITLGSAAASRATLAIGRRAVYRIGGNFNIGAFAASGSRLVNDGTLIKSASVGMSVIGASVTDAGVVEAASGELALARAVTGGGVLQIDAGATLELGAAAASALTVKFNGTGATLALGAAANCLATIAGFAAGDTIDLLETPATSASLEAGDRLAIMNGAQTVATLQLSGDYAGDTFDVASDGGQGSSITLASGPAGAGPPSVALFAAHISAFTGAAAAVADAASSFDRHGAIPPHLVAGGTRLL